MATEDAFKSPDELKAEIGELLNEKEQKLNEAMKSFVNILLGGM